MLDNPTIVESPQFTALPGYQVLALEGADAGKFAQMQFMNDVAALNTGHWQWNGWLSAKGRVLALFALLKLDETRIWLLLHDGDAAKLAEALKRYVFRSKLTLHVREDLHVAGVFTASSLEQVNTVGGDADSAILLDMGSEHSARQLRISTEPAPIDAAAASAWRVSNLRHGWPHLAGEQLEQFTPQQLSLNRLHAYSVKKGCYPGQEIVARTHFLGQAKRGLVLLQSDAELATGSDVSQDGQRLGQVVSSAPGWALAVMGEVAMDTTLESQGIEIRTAPLLNGLDR